MEARQMMTVNPLFSGVVGPVAPTTFGLPSSEGSAVFSTATGKIAVTGSATLGENILITVDNRGTPSTADDMLTVGITNLGLAVGCSVKLSQVKEIDITFGSGNNYVDDRSAVPLNVHAGNGNNTILGGSGSDYLQGGDGNDYIDGRGGDDMIYGMGGVDKLFGDDGDDTILGGNNDDYIFGGNGNDHLYGEAGNDHVYGGAGTDKLTDPTGTNTLYTDYGPDGTVSNSGYQSFDFFDRYLKDPTVRSQVRLAYNDGVLDRGDMFRLYTTVEADKTVSANEFNDLKALVSTKINMSADNRFFAGKVANGDVANAHYQGATLGNLKAGSTDVQLSKLVGKWYLGSDLPQLPADETEFGVHYEVVSGQLFQHPASPNDVAQGFTGNCGFMSALAAVADASPQAIQNMFIANGDGTYAVRFFDNGTPKFVTVNLMLPTTVTDMSEFAGWSGTPDGQYHNDAFRFDPSNILWVALAEKAYAEMNEQGWTGLDKTNSYGALNGIYPDKAQQQITGYAATVHKISGSSTLADLMSSLNGNKAITITSGKAVDGSPIAGGHAYVVTGYDQGTGMFTLYNPWGYENKEAAIHPTKVQLSVADIDKFFTSWADNYAI